MLKDKIKFKTLSTKTYIFVMIFITLLFIILGKMIVDGMTEQYYKHIIESALNTTSNYSNTLANSKKANELVNQLVSEKIQTVSNQLASSEDLSEELLTDFSETLGVDIIYLYNQDGEIVLSNTGQYIGWQAYEGHPAYDFMLSGELSFIDEIAKDPKSGEYFQYGYFTLEDGGFVQIGVKASKTKNLLESLSSQQVLIALAQQENILQVSVFDNDLNIRMSSDSNRVGANVAPAEFREDIFYSGQNEQYNVLEGEGKYEVLVPIEHNDMLGGLSIVFSSHGPDQAIKRVVNSGLVSLVFIYVLLIYALITTLRKNKKVIQIAYYDPLTTLPNKQYFKDFLESELKDKQKQKAIVLISCENLKDTNITFGFSFGDEVIKELAHKLQSLSGFNTKLFRLSDNKFVFYIIDYKEKSELLFLAKKITDLFNESLIIRGAKQYLASQIGIVEINSKNSDVDQLLKNAAITLDYVRQRDSLSYDFFDEEMEKKAQREIKIANEIRSALEKNNNNLYLEYQPQIDLESNKIIGYEALARLRSEELGFISPLEFINIAEKKQLIIPLGNWILRTACEFIKSLNRQGYNHIKVAVNVSGIQILQGDFTEHTLQLIDKIGVSPRNLEIEITESVALDDLSIVNEKLNKLSKAGINIALDDFGTGYSSLLIARELNINSLKIDKSFIDKLLVNKKEAMVKEIIAVSHKFGYKVVAEGVEIQQQKEYLKEHKCDIIQGYLLSKPLSEQKAIQFLTTGFTT